MAELILLKIKNLRDESINPNINVPRAIKSNLIYLTCLYNEYYMRKSNCLMLTNQIDKLLVQLIIKFSSNTIPDSIVHNFSDIIIMYLEQKVHEKKDINDLSNIFG